MLGCETTCVAGHRFGATGTAAGSRAASGGSAAEDGAGVRCGDQGRGVVDVFFGDAQRVRRQRIDAVGVVRRRAPVHLAFVQAIEARHETIERAEDIPTEQGAFPVGGRGCCHHASPSLFSRMCWRSLKRAISPSGVTAVPPSSSPPCLLIQMPRRPACCAPPMSRTR